MVKLLIKGTVLVLVLYLTILFISKFDNKQPINDENVLRLKAAKATGDMDFIFIGSSYVYSGIIPATFDSAGLRTFNLGVATAGPYFNELVVDDYLSEKHKTNNICLAVAYTTFSEIASDIWDQYPIHRYLSNPVSNETVMMRYASIKTYLELLRKSFKKGCENITIKKTVKIDTNLLAQIKDKKGYSLITDTVNDLKLKEEHDLFTPYLKGEYSFKKEKKITELIKKYEAQGIKVIITIPPTYKLKDYFTTEFKQHYEDFIERLKLQGIKVLRDSENNYNASCFRNTDHLNYTGAIRYSQFLKPYLTNI